MLSNNNDISISPLGTIIWALASLFFLYEFFLRTFVGTLAPQLMTDLHLTTTSFAVMGSAYYMAYSAMQVPVGMITSKLGVRKTLVFAVMVCALSAFLFAHATHLGDALFARILMGFGSSFAFVCLLVIATLWFPQQHFALLVGMSQFIGTMGPLLAAGPLAWILTQSHGDWRPLLTQISSAGLILAILILCFVKERSTAARPALVYLERSESSLTLLKRLFSNPQAWLISIYSATVYCAIAFLGAFWGTSYLQSHGFSQASAANIISIAWLGYAISCLGIGFISDQLRRRKPLLIICAATGLIATAIITFLPTLPASIYAILFFAIGFAASGQSIGFAAIAEHVATPVKPTALGLNNCMITLFSIVVPPVSGYIIGLSAQGHAPDFAPGDFTVGFTIMPILYMIGLVIATCLVKETFCRAQKEAVVLNTQVNIA